MREREGGMGVNDIDFLDFAFDSTCFYCKCMYLHSDYEFII